MTEITNLVNKQLDALLTNESNNIANLANASAFLFQTLADVNWTGFYIFDANQNELVLGPFQGNVACMHIKNGTGVCGTALTNKKPLRVPNVHEFAGHIACDSNSQSELVIPLYKDSKAIGVLDIDSPLLNRFSANDEQVLTQFAQVLLKHID